MVGLVHKKEPGGAWETEQDDGGLVLISNGPAGGDLTGTYPDPTLRAGAVNADTIAGGTITETQINAGNVDGAAATPSLRTLGTSAVQALAGNTRLDQLAAPGSNVAINGYRLTGLGAPTAADDAATKGYADAIASGLDVKLSVKAATTANITLSGTQTVDGVALIAGDRVLVKDQTLGQNNGIYVVAAGAWARSTDADTSGEVSAGMFTFIEGGTVHADSGWVLTTQGAITLGTTVLTFTQFSGVGGTPSGAAGGVLAGSYPNPTFASDMATQAELDAAVATLSAAVIFDKTATVLNDSGVVADNIVIWRAPYSCTVTAIKGWRTGGTGATINAGKGTPATPTNRIRSADLSLTAADTWTDGGAVQNTAFVAGDTLIMIIASTTGTVTQISVQVVFTKP